VALGFGPGLEEREEGDGGEVDGRDVGVKDGRSVSESLGFPELLFELGRRSGIGFSPGASHSRIGDWRPSHCLLHPGGGVAEPRRLIYFSLLDIWTRFSRSSFFVTSQGPILGHRRRSKVASRWAGPAG
jgi:hypothetical protein